MQSQDNRDSIPSPDAFLRDHRLGLTRDNGAAQTSTSRVFLQLNADIAKADTAGDVRSVDLLMAAKMGAVRRHHELLEQGR